MSCEGTERRMEALRREYESPAYWCPSCDQPDWHGEPEHGCTGCGARQEGVN